MALVQCKETYRKHQDPLQCQGFTIKSTLKNAKVTIALKKKMHIATDTKNELTLKFVMNS